MRTARATLAASLLFTFAAAASAGGEAILKCTDAAGRVEYRNSPCPAGRHATIVDTQEAPPSIDTERRLDAVRRESAEMTARLNAEAIARRERDSMAQGAYSYYAPQLEVMPFDDAYVPLYGGYFPARPCRNGFGCAMKPKRPPAPVKTAGAAPRPKPLPVQRR